LNFKNVSEPDKLDPADEMSWQHYLYSKLGKKEEQMIEETADKAASDKKGEEKKIEDTVERIVAMAKVLFGLHMVRFLLKMAKIYQIISLLCIATKYKEFVNFQIIDL
jgi:hypothetical protein